MKITIEMACSINGLIATENGNEDFLSDRNNARIFKKI